MESKTPQHLRPDFIPRADLKKITLTNAILSLDKDSTPPRLRVGLFDQDQQVQGFLFANLTQDGLKNNSDLWAIYEARITKKGAGAKGKAFLQLPQGAAMLGFANHLHEGQSVKVQIMREPFKNKGMQVSDRIKIQGRYMDFWPSPEPRKSGLQIEAARDLGKGRDCAIWLEFFENNQDWQSSCPVSDGKYILKSQITALSEDQAIEEALRLNHKASETLGTNQIKGLASLITPAPDLLQEIAYRLAPNAHIDFDDWEILAMAKKSFAEIAPDLVDNLHFQGKFKDLWTASDLAESYAQIQSKIVPLKQGARLIIEDTEALAVIDIDMGSALNQHGSDSASINLSSVSEIVRQIRLRELGGLIVIDPIKPDLGNKASTGKGEMSAMVEKLRSHFKHDDHKTDVLGITAGGLIEVIRQRLKAPIS